MSFELKLETALTSDNRNCAFTTNALSVVLDIPKQRLSEYFNGLRVSGNDPRKTLKEALALGLKVSGNEQPNSLYVFLEQISDVLVWAAPKYPKALQFLVLTSQKGILSYVAELHNTTPDTAVIDSQITALWESERNRHRTVWKLYCMSDNGYDTTNKLMKAYYGLNCAEFKEQYQLNPDAPADFCPDHTTISTLKELNDLREAFSNTSKRKSQENRIHQAVLATRKRN